MGVLGAETPNRAARAVGNDTTVANRAGPTAARPTVLSTETAVPAVRRVPGPAGAHPSRNRRNRQTPTGPGIAPGPCRLAPLKPAQADCVPL